MNPPILMTHRSYLMPILIVVGGVLLLYCIRRQLLPQLLFLTVLGAAMLALLYALSHENTLLAIVSLIVAIASATGFARAGHRQQAVT